MKRTSLLLLTLAFMTIICAIQGCISRQEFSTQSTGKSLRVLVLPMNKASDFSELGAMVRCIGCTYVFQTGHIDNGSEEFLSNRLVDLLRKQTTYEVIPWWEAITVTPADIQAIRHTTSNEPIIELGKTAQVDAVIVGTIYRFQDRVGKALSVETPSSVAFAIHMVRVSDGQLVWDQHFDETQKSLSENVLQLKRFFTRGIKWQTAEELAVSGLSETIANAPALKEVLGQQK